MSASTGPNASDLRVLVTGASGVIGKGVVHALLGRGARVLAQGRDAQRLAVLADEVPGALWRRCDLANPRERQGLVGAADEALGGINALVQCAGIARHTLGLQLQEADLDATLALNTVAPILLARDFAAILVARNAPGTIVSVASTLALRSAQGTLAYAASKAALVQAMRTLALELAQYAIRVNVVCPGVVDSPMVRQPRKDGRPPGQHLDDLTRLHPLGRLGTAEDVADAVLYLLHASWSTGSVLVMDGGLTIRE